MSKGTPEEKAARVARKQAESIPLEREEARRLGLDAFKKSADRMLYTRPVNRQASFELRKGKRK